MREQARVFKKSRNNAGRRATPGFPAIAKGSYPNIYVRVLDHLPFLL